MSERYNKLLNKIRTKFPTLDILESEGNEDLLDIWIQNVEETFPDQ
jgi:hypothetical protein